MRGRRLFHSLVIPTRLSLSLLFSQHHTMISLKPLITPIYAPLFPEPEFFRNRRNGLSSFCKSTNSDKSDEDNPSPPPPPPPPPPADIRNQELLARIAMLQTQKVRLTDYLDERSEYLTQFAEEANAEIDEIGENALKELDEAGARIMESIESRMQAFEESMELNKLEIEESEKEVADFVGQVEKERNEGLFFKSLGETKPVDKVKAKEEAQKVSEVTKKNAGSVVRRNIYLVLMGLVAIGIADASISSTSDWRKVAVLGAILVGLLSQFVYEQSMLSEAGKKEQEQSKESKRE